MGFARPPGLVWGSAENLGGSDCREGSWVFLEDETNCLFCRKIRARVLVDIDRQSRDTGRGRLGSEKWVDVLSCTSMLLVASRPAAASSAAPPGHDLNII